MFTVLWRDTTSETMPPGPFFYIDYNLVYLLFIITCSLFLFTFYCFQPHHTFNSLVYSKTGRLTTFLESWGQREVCVLCVGPRSLKRQITSTSLKTLKSYWIDNLGLNTDGKLPMCCIIPSNWGSPTGVCHSRHQANFCRRCRG